VERGTVRSFDSQAGTGEVEDQKGDVFVFHCTAIADGSRTIPVGVAVEFTPAPGHFGEWEAGQITRV
jgi:cold shock CspA family protein